MVNRTPGPKNNIEVWVDVFGHLLVIAPILLYWLYWTFNPSYWFHGDPEAIFLLDSLAVFNGQSYVYVDHPGTPVHVLGTSMLAVTFPFFGSKQAFIDFYIYRPEAFFLMTHAFLLAANIFTAIVLYRVVRSNLNHDRMLGAASLAVLFFTLHPYGFQSLTLWEHNSLNFPFATLLLIWLYRLIQREQEIANQALFRLGLANGILAVAQVYFYAWVATAIFTIFVYVWRSGRGLKQASHSSFFVLLGGLAGIASMLLPIYSEVPRFLDWFFNATLHQGIYGTGEPGFISLPMIAFALDYWWTYLRTLTLTLTFSLIALGAFIWRRRRVSAALSPSTQAMLAGLLLLAGMILVMMIKTAGKLRYALSLAALLPVLILVILEISKGTFWERFKLSRFVYVLIWVGIVRMLAWQLPAQDRFALEEREGRAAKSQALTRLAQELGVPKDEVVVVYTVGVPIQCAGMLAAMNWTGKFVDEITAMCPSQYFFFDSVIELNSAIPLLDIRDIEWDMVVWPGNGSNMPEYLESVGAVNIPKSWHIRRSRWFFIHPLDV
ncbi:MAG: hypothetical protein AB1649_02830 [Chloroflexota bacterium]